jgi:drug/metabolite transporter (DMT)-like permease
MSKNKDGPEEHANVPGASQVATAAVLFSISSIAMIILNKAAAVSFPHVAILLVFQNLATILILAMTSDIKPLSLETSLRWLPCAFLFCVNLFSSLQSLVFISVSTFTVLRNTQPLIAVAIDFVLRGQTTKAENVVYLMEILVGAILYCSHDMNFDLRGYCWAALHGLSMTCYSIIVKAKCSDLALSAPDMSYYNNVLSIPGLVVVGALEPLFRMGADANVVKDVFACGTQTWCSLVILLSCLGGYCVSVSGFQAQQVMSPTSWLCLNNFSKIPAIVISYVLFGGYFSAATVHGMLISVGCAYLYSVASKRATTTGMQMCGACLALSSCVWLHPRANSLCKEALCLDLPQAIRDGKLGRDEYSPQDWYAKPNCSLWGVTTTIFEPSPAIFQFVQQANTCIVVVGDQKTNHSSWHKFVSTHNGRAFYLSPGDQIRLPLHVIRHIPWNHFGRKNIGYLFVCRHKGKMIYDFDDDNMLRGQRTVFQRIVQGNLSSVPVVEKKHHLFNPYPGYEPVDSDNNPQFVWPRGFPLNFIHDVNTSTVSYEKMVHPLNVAVFQSLANNDPDVDAIFRMTRKLPITFQLEETIRAVPYGSYSPWNSQAVVVRDVGFWGLLLPISVTGRVSDIWRSYITSRMLFSTPYFVAFTSPFVDQYRNPHDYQIDLVDEQDLYFKTNELIKTISEFSVEKSAPFHANLIRLVDSLHQREIVGEADVKLARAWVLDLQSLNYSWPTMTRDIRPFTPPQGRVLDFRRFSLDDLANRTVARTESLLNTASGLTRSTRTAVCVTGQIRSLNLKPGSPTWPPHLQVVKTDWTVADSIQQNLFSVLGDFDVFMTIATREGPREPKIGDKSACEPLRPKRPGSKLFCEVVREKDRAVHQFPAKVWKNFYVRGYEQGLLQQLYGLLQCASNIRRHMFSSGVHYDYIVRLRPDTWFHLPMPPVAIILTSRNVIKFANGYGGGNEDCFGLGHSQAMFPYLDRYLALQTLSDDIEHFFNSAPWTAESFLMEYMKFMNITLAPDARIAAGIVKPTTRAAPSTA